VVRTVAGALLLISACGFSVPDGSSTPVDAAAIDAPPDAPDAMTGTVGDVCYGTLVHVCFPSAPTGAVTPVSFNTGTDAACTLIYAQSDGEEVCVIAADTITIGGDLTVTGPRPLVLVAATTITVTGTIDVSSTTMPSRRGAGSQGLACTLSAAGANDRGGGGGGGGGTFSTRGGTGGTGDTNQNGPPAGMAPGGQSGTAQPAPVTLRGGCRAAVGGEGGDSDGVNPGGPGGLGGGAVALVSGGAVTVPGAVYASGAGGGTIAGQPGTGNCIPGNGGFEQGGGGGGSGGMIVLDGAVLTVSGRIVANGGGGGGGGACFGGARGSDGTTMQWNLQASGGMGDVVNGGANGGAGSARAGLTTLDGLANISGGGGGGGGLGYVWTKGPLTGGVMISPAPVSQ
jgi:hypothetical protein